MIIYKNDFSKTPFLKSQKFTKLNKNLKLEIFDFLQIKEIFETSLNLNRLTRKNILEKRMFKMLLTNYKTLLLKVNFQEKENISFYEFFNEKRIKTIDIIVYFLIKRFKDINFLRIDGN